MPDKPFNPIFLYVFAEIAHILMVIEVNLGNKSLDASNDMNLTCKGSKLAYQQTLPCFFSVKTKEDKTTMFSLFSAIVAFLVLLSGQVKSTHCKSTNMKVTATSRNILLQKTLAQSTFAV